MENNNMEDRLFCPANIKTRYEFVSGFGFNELAVTVIVAGIFAVITFFINLLIIKNNYNAVLVVSVFAVAVGMVVRKNEMNQSIADIVKLTFQFQLRQQKFKYTYFSPYTRR